MEWKEHWHRKEVGPREGARRRKARAKERALERASKGKVSPLRERAKVQTRKVSKVENPTKIEQVYVEEVQFILVFSSIGPGRPFNQNEPELTRLALKQMRDLGLTAIPSDKDSGFVLMKLSDIFALHKKILVVEGYNENDINLLCMSTSLWKWAKLVSDHEWIQELKKELVLDHSRFGMDGAIAQLETNP